MPVNLFVSDMHMGDGAGMLEPNAWSWCRQSTVDNFLKFLDYINSRNDISNLILLGDMFDTWIFPYDITPPTMDSLIACDFVRPVIEKIQQLAQKINVIFCGGNHDILLNTSILKRYFPNMSDLVDFVVISNIRAEHGHARALFNAPDLDVPDNLPFGYFISRVYATIDRDTGSHSVNYIDFKRTLSDAFKGENVSDAILDIMTKKAGMSRDAIIKMPRDLWGGRNVSLEQVISIYSNIVERFEKRNGKIATVLSIPAELDHLEYAADRLYAENIQTIIMGHTHIPAIISQHEGTYANTGYWGSDPENETWIEVENNMKPILYKFSQLNL